MRRNEEVINVRDAVLLKSGPRKKDLPFVARVAAIWEDDEGTLMIIRITNLSLFAVGVSDSSRPYDAKHFDTIVL